MQRDMDLVRQILLAAEAADADTMRMKYLTVEGYDAATVAYHVKLMHQAGLVEASVVEPDNQPPTAARVIALTWTGHDWLDATRNDTVWSKTRKWVAEKGGGASFEVLKAIATKYALAHFGLKEG
jgi:hypothetical protein